MMTNANNTEPYLANEKLANSDPVIIQRAMNRRFYMA